LESKLAAHELQPTRRRSTAGGNHDSRSSARKNVPGCETNTMLKKVADEIADCYRRAAEAREKAERFTDPDFKRDFLELESSWLFLARSLEFTERLRAFQHSSAGAQPDPRERPNEFLDESRNPTGLQPK